MVSLREFAESARQRHPWEQVRAEFYAARLADCLPKRPLTLLDAGCGDASLTCAILPSLPAGCRVTGWDPGLDDTALAAIRATLPATISLTKEEPRETFDALLCMDMLEHVADDRGLLSHLVNERVKPGGLVMVSVPAWPALFSRHDLAMHHYRRYTRAAASRLLKSSGVTIMQAGGLFHAAALARALQVMTGKRETPLAEPQHYDPGGDFGLAGFSMPAPLRAGYLLALKIDAGFGRLLGDLPGLSWWAIGRRG